jgi:hypothetical protein
VYYFGRDFARHAFPNEKTYFTWYYDFRKVKRISDTLLATIPLGTNVTYRPGIRLIKLTSDPKVYAVEAPQTLRWLESELIAHKFFGPTWRDFVHDVPEVFFQDYELGPSLMMDSLYHRDIARLSTPTIDHVFGLTPLEQVSLESISQGGGPFCYAQQEFTAFLTEEMQGEQVQVLQELLLCLGYFPSNVSPSGYFGPVTRAALLIFQVENNLGESGEVNAETREFLNKTY